MPEQTLPGLDELLRVLSAATDKKTLQWTQTADEDTFRTQGGFGLVRISKYGAAPASYTLSLIDQEGVLLHEYESTGEGALIAIEALYNKVRRQALDLDQKLRGFFEDLKLSAGVS